MDMVCHQAIRMQRAPAFPEAIAQENEINVSIGVIAKACAPVVPALPHVQRDIRKH